MIECKCEQCGGEFPVNSTLRVAGRILCDACCEQVLAQSETPQTDPQRQCDPTICANCQNDNGTVELPRLAGLPVCAPCENFFRNRPFPPWIKFALAAVVALVVFSLAWNLRFFRAYVAFRRSITSWTQGQAEPAASRMSAAAGYVPECDFVRTFATYMEGVSLLHQDKCAEALAKLTQCQDRLPLGHEVEIYILQARGGVTFDAKDYDGFLAAAQALEQKMPTHYLGKATVASALACKYVQTGDKSFHDRAVECLDAARSMAQGDPQFEEYEDRIRHRLDAREIITYQEFQQRFPNGWKRQKEN
jgi:hypothetical protein